ncbi:uncharacterized protein LOC113351959 [Papaver somniferum]|uniref:uncharacterized protein LOC113351959 n=1 Tax=Papaver somniferum TaxID=3469 RepID=UPI000E6FE1CD|nr:uncharacterized protein LOC113351959 [Papaver somniferum]
MAMMNGLNSFKENFKTKNWLEYYKKSSIWPGIKWVAADVFEHSRWLVGDGKNISFWNDIWIKDKPFKDIFPENAIMLQNPKMKVAELIRDGEWKIPASFLEFFSTSELPVIDNKEDRRIWSATTSGKFTVASASDCIRKKYHSVHWAKIVWHKSVHPNVSSNVWKIVRGVVPSYENMKKKKFQLASRCPFCKKEEENMEHILWFCDFSEIIWNWLGGIFQFTNPKSLKDILKFAKHKSPAIKDLWRVAALVTLKEIWFLRNKIVYEEEQLNISTLKQRILRFTKESDVRMIGNMWNSTYDLQLLKFFGLNCRRVKLTKITEIYFHLPNPPIILLCCDGASRGSRTWFYLQSGIW